MARQDGSQSVRYRAYPWAIWRRPEDGASNSRAAASLPAVTPAVKLSARLANRAPIPPASFAIMRPDVGVRLFDALLLAALGVGLNRAFDFRVFRGQSAGRKLVRQFGREIRRVLGRGQPRAGAADSCRF